MKISKITKVTLQNEKQYYDVIEANPYNNFIIKTNAGYVVSHNCNLTDEVNFGVGNNVEKQKAKQKKMISQIDARMRSRFLRGRYLPTLNIIISSKDTEQAFLDDYIKSKKEHESTTSLIIDEPQWVVDQRKGTPNDPGAFWVALGGKFLAHELLPKDASDELVEKYREKGYIMKKVPPGYRETFEDNLDQALMDILGYSTSSSTKYISGLRLNQAKDDSYRNPFTKDVIEVGNSPDDHLQYANFFDLSRVNPRDLTRPLFIHLDMSISGDKTGIAGVWITGKRATVEGEDTSRSLSYKLAFSVSVKAPKGYQVSFTKNRNFINWLRDRGFAIKGISSDTFQSATILQELQSDGFNTNILSVDRVTSSPSTDKNGAFVKQCIPYAFLKTAIYEQHIKIYKQCELLTEELTELERLPGGKIDHPDAGSKDQADAVTGALYSASQFADQYSFDYGESMSTMLEVNNEDYSEEARKKDLIANFEKELAALYHEEKEALQVYSKEKQDEYKYYQDLADGILII